MRATPSNKNTVSRSKALSVQKFGYEKHRTYKILYEKSRTSMSGMHACEQTRNAGECMTRHCGEYKEMGTSRFSLDESGLKLFELGLSHSDVHLDSFNSFV